MLGLLIVGVTELLRSPEDRAYHRKLEGDRIERMHQLAAAHEYLNRENAERERRRNGLAYQRVVKPTVNASRKSSLRSW